MLQQILVSADIDPVAAGGLEIRDSGIARAMNDERVGAAF